MNIGVGILNRIAFFGTIQDTGITMPAFFGIGDLWHLLLLRAKEYILRTDINTDSTGDASILINDRRHRFPFLSFYFSPLGDRLVSLFLTDQDFPVKHGVHEGVIQAGIFVPCLLPLADSAKMTSPMSSRFKTSKQCINSCWFLAIRFPRAFFLSLCK